MVFWSDILALSTDKQGASHLAQFTYTLLGIQGVLVKNTANLLKADSIITLRDVETLNLIKRGAHVSVNFKDDNINISFSASLAKPKHLALFLLGFPWSLPSYSHMETTNKSNGFCQTFSRPTSGGAKVIPNPILAPTSPH